MQYIEVLFDFDFQEEYQRDLFVQGLADLGFESFTDDAAYLPANLFDEQALRAYASENSQTIRSISEVPDQNWNAAWEAEHPVQELPLGVCITPHCAFGAGYHETTSMMIDALLTRDLSRLTVLDMAFLQRNAERNRWWQWISMTNPLPIPLRMRKPIMSRWMSGLATHRPKATMT